MIVIGESGRESAHSQLVCTAEVQEPVLTVHVVERSKTCHLRQISCYMYIELYFTVPRFKERVIQVWSVRRIYIRMISKRKPVDQTNYVNMNNSDLPCHPST